MSTENTTYINYLIEISKSGRHRGFLDLCEIILPNVYTVVFRLLNDEESAKKITVKTFMQAWHQMKYFDVKKPFIVWIKSVAILLSMEELNKTASLFQMTLSENETKGSKRDLDSLIKTLPTLNRIIFVLHDLEGYSYKEILQFFPDLIEDELKTNLIQTRQHLIGNLTQ
ncbi:MAG: ECF subfamily RNA polymerase sigma-24 factor [Ignavibacteria bacterium]|nr:MAG: ECF subfamily RNA polymerase sigma-24 factor [Ignavibacteria bacterium]KAF0156126.1 MAG: ECF subfamily RNA polymerase sigma-24 factor [Ignavibacteria bacterium]